MLDDPIMLAKAIAVQADDMLLRAGVVAMLDWLDEALVLAYDDEDYEFDAMEMLEVLVQTTLLGHYHLPTEEGEGVDPSPVTPLSEEDAERFRVMLGLKKDKKPEDET